VPSTLDQRSGAVPSFTLNLDQFQTPQIHAHAIFQPDDNLTPLPALSPDAPPIEPPAILPNLEKRCLPLTLHLRHDQDESAQTNDDPFFALPYAHTRCIAGPVPRTATEYQRHGNGHTASATRSRPEDAEPRLFVITPLVPNVSAAGHGGEAAVETGVEQAELSEKEVRSTKRKRILWVVATVSLVLIATAGILIGIIWKLGSIA